MARPHVQVIVGDDCDIPITLRESISRIEASASFRPLPDAVRRGVPLSADTIVIIVPEDSRPITHLLRVLFDRLAESPRAVLLLKASGGLVPRLTHPKILPVTFGCELDSTILSARLGMMIEMRPSLHCLHEGLQVSRRSREGAAQRYYHQLRLASQVQRELIPTRLPRIGRLSFSALFKPADYVSGDFYGVHRLDESHIAMSLVDATGHGIPAALMTVFIKRALRGKETAGGKTRILRPDEVLGRLNAELIDADLTDCSFVAAAYAVLNTRTLTLSLARAGAPYPILRRATGALELLRPAGSIAGINPEAEYAVETVQLQAKDTLIMMSDGIEPVVLPNVAAEAAVRTVHRARAFGRFCPGTCLVAPAATQRETTVSAASTAAPNDGQPAAELATLLSPPQELAPRDGDCGWCEELFGPGPEETAMLDWAAEEPPEEPQALSSAVPPDEALLATSWCRLLQEQGPAIALDQLAVRYDSLRRMGRPVDDLTVLSLHVRA